MLNNESMVLQEQPFVLLGGKDIIERRTASLLAVYGKGIGDTILTQLDSDA